MSVAAEERVSGRLFIICVIPASGCSRSKLSPNRLWRVTLPSPGMNSLSKATLRNSRDVARIEERLRLAFDVDNQRPGDCRLAIAAHQMQPQRFGQGCRPRPGLPGNRCFRTACR